MRVQISQIFEALKARMKIGITGKSENILRIYSSRGPDFPSGRCTGGFPDHLADNPNMLFRC
jgi:hypothetical protein